MVIDLMSLFFSEIKISNPRWFETPSIRTHFTVPKVHKVRDVLNENTVILFYIIP